MKQMLEYHTAMVESKHELRDTPFAIPFTTSLEVMVIAAGGHVPHMGKRDYWVRDWSAKSVGNEEFCTTFHLLLIF